MRKSRIFLFPLRKLIMQKIFAGKIKWICEYAGYDLWDTIILIILARKLDLSILNYYMRNANNSVMSRAILAHNLQILGKKNCTKMHKMFQGKVTILKIHNVPAIYWSGNVGLIVFYLQSYYTAGLFSIRERIRNKTIVKLLFMHFHMFSHKGHTSRVSHGSRSFWIACIDS